METEGHASRGPAGERLVDVAYVEIDLFKKLLPLVARLPEEGLGWILVVPGGSLRWRMREDGGRLNELCAEIGIDRGSIDASVPDLLDVVAAQMVGTPRDVFSRVRADEGRLESGDAEDPSIAAQKYDLVAGEIDIDAIRQRVWLKDTAKNDVFDGVHWDIVNKIATSESAPFERMMPSGVVQLWVHRPGIGRSSNGAFSIDREDLSSLIAQLQDLKNAMDVAS